MDTTEAFVLDWGDEMDLEDAAAAAAEEEEEFVITEAKLAARQKQIDYGKNTLAYQRYVQEVPKQNRRLKGRDRHPQTPEITQKTSKRCFDGQVRAWRRQLHHWDPPEAAAAAGAAATGKGASGRTHSRDPADNRSNSGPTPADAASRALRPLPNRGPHHHQQQQQQRIQHNHKSHMGVVQRVEDWLKKGSEEDHHTPSKRHRGGPHPAPPSPTGGRSARQHQGGAPAGASAGHQQGHQGSGSGKGGGGSSSSGRPARSSNPGGSRGRATGAAAAAGAAGRADENRRGAPGPVATAAAPADVFGEWQD